MLTKRVSLTIETQSSASFTTYIRENYDSIDPTKTRAAVVICPGGGYAGVSAREAEPVALALVAQGFQAFVLNYSVAPARYPQALRELAATVRSVRRHAGVWHIDPNQIIVAGFSAGGHLAAQLGVYWHQPLLRSLGFLAADVRPNALMLGYPVISGEQYVEKGSLHNLLGPTPTDAELAAFSVDQHVDADTPATFLWHTMTDQVVPVENTLLFAVALRAHHIPCAVHLFSTGEHGLSLGTAESANVANGDGISAEVAAWPALFTTWINSYFATTEKKEG